jgi:hypothetical protein
MGEIVQSPPPRSNSDPNTEGEEYRGRHSHATPPLRDTSAAERQSPISAKSAIGDWLGVA